VRELVLCDGRERVLLGVAPFNLVNSCKLLINRIMLPTRVIRFCDGITELSEEVLLCCYLNYYATIVAAKL